jgi:hypothetical protein
LVQLKSLALAVFLAAGAGLVGCNPQEPTTGDAVGAADEALDQQKDAYVQQMEAALDRTEQQLEQFREKAASMTGGAKAEAELQIQALEEQTEATRDKLGEVESATAETWQDMKAGMDAALQNLEAAYEQAATQFS